MLDHGQGGPEQIRSPPIMVRVRSEPLGGSCSLLLLQTIITNYYDGLLLQTIITNLFYFSRYDSRFYSYYYTQLLFVLLLLLMKRECVENS